MDYVDKTKRTLRYVSFYVIARFVLFSGRFVLFLSHVSF